MSLSDIQNQKFNRLTAVEFSHKDSRYISFWRFKCDCGNEIITSASKVRQGLSKSCGCLQKELISQRSKTHGMEGTSIYGIWHSMKQRCENKSHAAYPHYGGRGITVCDAWSNSFSDFYKDMGDKPANRSLDRINNDLGYSPENCQWATHKQQMNNRRITSTDEDRKQKKADYQRAYRNRIKAASCL